MVDMKCGNCQLSESIDGTNDKVGCSKLNELRNIESDCAFNCKEDKSMKLSDTVEMMNSEDYRKRFRSEYLQLKIRMDGLSVMLEKYKDGTLSFQPKCSYDLLNSQLRVMTQYAMILEERARIEGI